MEKFASIVMKNSKKCRVTQNVTLGIVGRRTVLAHLFIGAQGEA